MSQTLKLFISIFGIILAILAVYFGSYLPYQKAKYLISVMNSVKQGVGFEEFKKIQAFQLDYYSPVGQDESVKQLANTSVSALSQSRALPPNVVTGVLELNHKYFDPIVGAGRGGNFSQDIMLMGQIYEFAAQQANNKDYLDKSAEYFKLGLEYSPKRPQFLYGLYSVAQAGGDKEGMKKYGEEILKYWDDSKIKNELEALR